MIEKANACSNARFSSAVEIQFQADVCLVCLAMNSGGSRHGADGSAFLNSSEKLLHFFFGADGDADEAGTHVAATIAEENVLALESLEKRGTAGAEIGEEKISCAGINDYAELLQFRGEPGAQAFYRTDVAPNGRAILNCSLRGN